MMIRIEWTDSKGLNQWRAYEDMDDVSLKIHNLIMQRFAFSVEYI